MKIILEFNVKDKKIPTDYRRYFVSWIKNTLSQSHEGKYYEQYYKDTNEKPYTFTINFNQPKFQRDSILLTDQKIRMYFSVTDEKRTSFILMNCFLKMKYIDFNLPEGNKLVLVNIRQMNTPLIEEEHCLFRTMVGSSILVREHNRETNKDIYHTIIDNNYIEKLEDAIKRQCERRGYSDEEVKQIKVNDVQGKKVVVKNYNILIDGTSGVIDLSAPKAILNDLYTIGMGSKRSLGFGCIEKIN